MRTGHHSRMKFSGAIVSGNKKISIAAHIAIARMKISRGKPVSSRREQIRDFTGLCDYFFSNAIVFERNISNAIVFKNKNDRTTPSYKVPQEFRGKKVTGSSSGSLSRDPACPSAHRFSCGMKDLRIFPIGASTLSAAGIPAQHVSYRACHTLPPRSDPSHPKSRKDTGRDEAVTGKTPGKNRSNTASATYPAPAREIFPHD